MVKRFESLRENKKGSTQAALQLAFEVAFPECAFTSGTVYKHLRIYDDAAKFQVLEKFVNFGKTSAGKWNEVVKIVEERRKTVEPGKCLYIYINLSHSDSDLYHRQSLPSLMTRMTTNLTFSSML
jgi:hypothetical protein